MSRVYGEPVDVRVRDGRPARFVWRGRLYTVLRVLEHWVVSREWWTQQALEHSREQSREQGREQPKDRDGKPGEPSEHEFWQVEASPGRNLPPAAYELRRDAASGDWLLARVWDLGQFAGGCRTTGEPHDGQDELGG